MRYGFVVSSILAFNLSTVGHVFAGCADEGYFAVADFSVLETTMLNGWAINATNPDGTENWKEDHCASILDTPANLYKVGDGSAVDPRALRGTWTPNSDGTVTYNYGSPATTYTWALYTRRGVSDLCWENPDDGAVIATGGAYQAAGTCP